jgi:hypothetical protein
VKNTSLQKKDELELLNALCIPKEFKLEMESHHFLLVNCGGMSEEKTNYLKHIIVGSSLVAASIVGYYLWKQTQTPEVNSESTSIFQATYSQYLENYEKQKKKEKIFLTRNEIIQCLCLIESKEQLDSKLHKILKLGEDKNIPLSLFLFIQSENKEFSKTEIFKKIFTFLSQPNCSRRIVECSKTAFNLMVHFIQFYTEKKELELFICETIKQNRLFF